MFVSEALAQTAGAAAAPGGGDMFGFLLPMVAIFAVMWFFMIRPQQKKQKEHQAMIRAAKRGDKIVTSGGILGTITKSNEADNDVEVEIATGVKVRVVRSAISDIVQRTSEAAKPASKEATKEGANDA